MKIEIGIDAKDRKAVAQILGKLLADEFLLYTKTRNFHWNITGPRFSELHKFFEGQYEELDETIDEVAERMRALGSPSLGSPKEFLAHTRLKEVAGATTSADVMLKALLGDHESLIRALREDLRVCMEDHHDAGTSDFLTALLEGHEKTAWMLRSYLQD